MRNYLLVGLTTFLILGFVAYAIFKQNKTAVPPTQILDLTPTLSQISPTVVLDDSDLRRGGSSLLDPKGVYSLLYPSEYKQDSQNNGQEIRLFKTGKTQRGQTEMYDGVIIVLESVSLEGRSLEEWVDKKISDSTVDGTIKIIEPKKQIKINSYPGFTYRIRGLGESQYYVVQKNQDSDNAVVITTLVADPQDIDFQSEVDLTLSTLELLK